MSFKISDEMLTFLTKHDVGVSWHKDDMAQSLWIKFSLPISTDLFDVLHKIKLARNNFARSVIHPDNWFLLEEIAPDNDVYRSSFRWKSHFHISGLSIQDYDNINALEIKNNTLVLSDDYNSLMNWLNEIVVRNKIKPLSNEEILDILKTSYKDDIRSNYAIKK